MATAVSLLLVLVSISLIFQQGLSYGIDFVGGTEVQVTFQKDQTVNALREEVKKYFQSPVIVQKVGEGSKEFLIRLTGLKDLKEKQDQKKLNRELQRKVSSMVKNLSSTHKGLTLDGWTP